MAGSPATNGYDARMGAALPRRRPAYALSSVDNALRLVQMLRDLGELRVKDAATELGVSSSTVHRLMSMLVFRGFAIQDESRAYRPGPAIGVQAVDAPTARQVQEAARPHLHALRDEIGESSNLMILTGTEVRFLLTAEATGSLHAHDRHGFVLPAHRSSGGRAILATLESATVGALYADELDETELNALLGEVALVRARGYASSADEAERGIASVAAPIRGGALAAVSLAAPTAASRTIMSDSAIERLLVASERIAADLRRPGS